uniref:DNA/RNA-binding protein Kin17 WH-like domain-containing protein n=1 Tax=Panagrolaimus superbus TaxID=310955 RepID=A0A914YBV2_9BILA
MPRAEKGSAKAIANKVKSKGLQKLKWFCQMCNKQCRDQNGFKCHLTSESHQRQLLLFAENQNSYLREFSREFESSFMRILRHQFGSKRIRANEVYQEVIKDKGHIHMNSTVWHTLTGFILYLGSSGKCKIDQGEKGWYIQYIDQEEELRRNKIVQRAKKEKDEEDRNNDLLERQINRALEKEKETGVEDEEPVQRDLIRENDDEKIKISLAPRSLVKPENEKVELKATKVFETADEKGSSNSMKRPSSSKSEASSSKKSALDKIMEEEERYKERKNRKDYWLHEGIIVKVVTKKLGSEYYKAKGEIVELVDKYTAKVDVDGDILKLDQGHLETVIPAVGKDMLIVNGGYRGTKAILLEIKERDYCLLLKLKEGLKHGREVTVAYEDASKLA